MAFKNEDRIRKFVADVARLDPHGGCGGAWDDPEDALNDLPRLTDEARKIARYEGFGKMLRSEDDE